MPLRTIKKHQSLPFIEYLRPASIVIILVGGIIFIRSFFVNQTNPDQQSTSSGQALTMTGTSGSVNTTATAPSASSLLDWKVGNTISVEGIITASSDSSTRHSHLLITSDNIKYGLVATNIALGGSDGYTNVEGTIVDIINALPIIEVKKLTTLSQSGFKRESGVSYLDQWGITLNPSAVTNSTASVSGSTITIQTPAGTTKVSAFVCGSGRSNNCKKMLQDLEKPETQSFAGSNGQLYYQLGSPQERFTAHTDVLRGYTFSVPNDQALIEASQIINIIDKQFIESSLLADLKRVCSAQGEISTISTINFVTVDPVPILSIKGVTEQKKTINCTAKLSLNGSIPLIAINVSAEGSNAPTTTNTPSSVNTGTQTSYKTTDGLTLVRPEDTVSVKAMLSRENFGIIGLSCAQKLSLTPKLESAGTGNIAMIYLCQSQRPADQLINEQTKKLTHLIASGNRHIYIQLNNPEWYGFVQDILVK